MKMLKTLYQTDCYTLVHIMDPALSLRISICMRVLLNDFFKLLLHLIKIHAY